MIRHHTADPAVQDPLRQENLCPPSDSSPLGLHRVLEPAGRACPQAAAPARRRGRSSGRTRCGSTSRRSTSTRRRTASWPRSTQGDGDAVRAEVLDIVADARQDAEPGHRVGRHARRHGRRGRPGEPARPGGRGPGGHPRVAVADAAGHHRRARAVGRPQRAGPRRRPRDPLRPLHRRRPARRPRPAARAHGHGRLRRPGPGGPWSCSDVCDARRSASSAGRQVRARCRSPPPATPAPVA